MEVSQVVGGQLRDITDADFERVMSTATGPVLVEFFATWCGACRRLAPVLDAVAEELAGQVEVVKVNVDENPGVVGRYEVSSTPTLVLFAAGAPVTRRVGAQPEAPLRAWLEEALASQPLASQSVVAADGSESWAPIDACTLPTEAQPLRVAEFGDLFAASLRGVLRVSSTRLRLELDAAAEDTVRDLTARETDCCGFFSFSVNSAESDTVWLDVQVPASRVEVLDGLAAQAQAARAA
jgi:thioredoxin